MNTRASMAAMAATVLLLGGLTGCTQTVSGTPGPAPTVSGGGDFPTTDGSSTPTDGSGSDTPTADPTVDETDTPAEDGSVDQLCSDLSDAVSTPGLGEDGYSALVSLVILGWGLGNGDTDPFSSVDAATEKSCPDVRDDVLGKTGTPDLKSTGD